MARKGQQLGAAIGRFIDRVAPPIPRQKLPEETPFMEHLGMKREDLSEIMLKKLMITKGYDPGQLEPRYFNLLRRRYDMGDSNGIPVDMLLHVTPNDLYLNRNYYSTGHDSNGVGPQTISAIETALRHVISNHLTK